MSSPNESGAGIERWWQLLVILFGLIFLTLLVSFSPTI
ncbi:hypothetical protein GRAN_0079 [Granulicella sibirica]|uniref:Uncharacterized protein n=1 Tax=Granulicella sibirica TaxID=2479048 RepID=A0A4Q0T458_9BACT|nr:hypothetical protein GRAN_0079 [Granulicella sibirica]